MQVLSLKIENLKSIRELEISFEDVTALMGANNAGKSTVLKAMELFFSASVNLSDDDYHKRSVDQILITLTFGLLTPAEREEFGSAVIDNTITIQRSLGPTHENHLQYSVLTNVFPGFEGIRLETNKTTKRVEFNRLADAIEGLERARNDQSVEDNMKAWEAENTDQLELRFLRGFFGAPNVANGKLKKKTALHFIPAVADADQEASKSKSPLIKLLSDISRQIYENRQEVQTFITKVNADFEELVAPDNFPQLASISESLTTSIQQYYKDSKLTANWQNQEGIKVQFPQPVIQIEDQGFPSSLANVGHGLQRAALFAIIQFLAEQDAQEDGDRFEEPQSDIILLIEEPEIYQHPHKQELISQAFYEICEDFSESTGIRFQIVFTTHSEKFIGISKFQSARILRRDSVDEIICHSASSISVKECCAHFAALLDKEPISEDAFEAKMHIFTREVCEGFFAEKVILVEGVTDKAIMDGYYQHLGRNRLAEGISIIQMDGKTKMDKPFYIFNKLGIPTFCIFDSDANKPPKKQKPAPNLLLQKIACADHPVEFPDGVFANFAAYENNLETYLKSVLEDGFEEDFDALSEEYGLPKSDILKTPMALTHVFARALEEGKVFEKLDSIVKAVDSTQSF